MKKEFISETTLRHMLAHPLLSREAEAGLSKRIKAGDETARHELVRHNLRLAWAFAMRGEMGGGARTKDLFGEAVMALYRAAKRFDSALGTFAQFCEFHLREAWRKHARFEGYPTGKSRALRAQVDQVAWQWLERTGRERVRQLEGEGLAQLRFMLADGIGAERKAASAQAWPPADADPRFSVVHDSTRPRRVLPVKSAESPEDDGRSTRQGVRRLEEEALARLPVIVGGGVFREQGAACDGVTNWDG